MDRSTATIMNLVNKRQVMEQHAHTYFNGYAFFNDDNFHNHFDEPCYIPENSNSDDEIYSRNDLTKIVSEWLSSNETIAYLTHAYDGNTPIVDDKLIETFVIDLYENVCWEMPKTYLDNASY